MKYLISIIIAASAFGLGSIGTALAMPGASADTWSPPGNTVVKVTGDKANGFGIYYLDGSSIFPPTDSEAAAECSEYDTRVARVRCNAEVRTWYRDLAVLKRSINYAQSL